MRPDDLADCLSGSPHLSSRPRGAGGRQNVPAPGMCRLDRGGKLAGVPSSGRAGTVLSAIDARSSDDDPGLFEEVVSPAPTGSGLNLRRAVHPAPEVAQRTGTRPLSRATRIRGCRRSARKISTISLDGMPSLTHSPAP